MHLHGLEFFALDVRLSEHKRCGEITPDEPAAIVGKMQVVPRRRLELPRKLFRRCTALVQSETIGPFERRPVRPIQGPQIKGRESDDLQRRLTRVSLGYE